jgi:hypothetical protein
MKQQSVTEISSACTLHLMYGILPSMADGKAADNYATKLHEQR